MCIRDSHINTAITHMLVIYISLYISDIEITKHNMILSLIHILIARLDALGTTNVGTDLDSDNIYCLSNENSGNSMISILALSLIHI